MVPVHGAGVPLATPFDDGTVDHDSLAALESYYREATDESPTPGFCIAFRSLLTALGPETAASLAEHDNVAGIKDSSGSFESLQRSSL